MAVDGSTQVVEVVPVVAQDEATTTARMESMEAIFMMSQSCIQHAAFRTRPNPRR